MALDLVPRLLGRLARREVVLLAHGRRRGRYGGIHQLLAAWGLAAALAAPGRRRPTPSRPSWSSAGSSRGRPTSASSTAWPSPPSSWRSRLELERVHRDLRDLNASLDDRVRERSAELQDEKDRIGALLDAIPDLMFEIDADGPVRQRARPRRDAC